MLKNNTIRLFWLVIQMFVSKIDESLFDDDIIKLFNLIVSWVWVSLVKLYLYISSSDDFLSLLSFNTKNSFIFGQWK